MCGCWRLAVSLISARKRSAPITAASSGRKHLKRDAAVVAEVFGEIDGGHSAGADLAVDAVAVGQSGLEPVEQFCHVCFLVRCTKMEP